jgi:Fe-S cluster biogenesis protein NfuA
MTDGLTGWTIRVRSALDVLVSSLRSDGADVVVIRCDPEASKVSVRYIEGSCNSCTMSASDVARLLEEGLRAAVGSEVHVQIDPGP